MNWMHHSAFIIMCVKPQAKLDMLTALYRLWFSCLLSINSDKIVVKISVDYWTITGCIVTDLLHLYENGNLIGKYFTNKFFLCCFFLGKFSDFFTKFAVGEFLKLIFACFRGIFAY